MDLKSTYNQIAKDWHKDHIHDDWWIKATDQFISLLKPGDVVLDVGCGTGVKSKYLTEKGLKVVGIDFSEKMIEIAKREVHQGTFRVMDMHDLSSLHQKFDAIFVQAALLHIPKAQVSKVLSGLIDRLKKKGYLYVGVKKIRQGKKDEEIVKENDYGYDYERFFSYFTLDEIKKYLTNLRMTISYEDVTASGKTNWVQVIARLQ
jgi:2-polyprenyl-3-methyl-5-hydroxy-6-metoxy-1,4-benzoquinol methylase